MERRGKKSRTLRRNNSEEGTLKGGGRTEQRSYICRVGGRSFSGAMICSKILKRETKKDTKPPHEGSRCHSSSMGRRSLERLKKERRKEGPSGPFVLRRAKGRKRGNLPCGGIPRTGSNPGGGKEGREISHYKICRGEKGILSFIRREKRVGVLGKRGTGISCRDKEKRVRQGRARAEIGPRKREMEEMIASP